MLKAMDTGPTPNPYQPPAIPAESPIGPLQCPHCHSLAENLKHYEVIQWCVFVVVYFWILPANVIACPACMRRILWQRCLANILPANLLWPAWLLPRTLIQVAATYIAGSSRSVIEAVRKHEARGE